MKYYIVILALIVFSIILFFKLRYLYTHDVYGKPYIKPEDKPELFI